MERPYTNSIQDFIDDGTSVTIFCHSCNHRGELDLVKLRDRLGPDHGMLFDEIKDYLRCGNCRGKKISIIRHAYVMALDTPGHTRGHMSVLVASGGVTMLVTGDALANIHFAFDHPDWSSFGTVSVNSASRRENPCWTARRTIGFSLPATTTRSRASAMS